MELSNIITVLILRRLLGLIRPSLSLLRCFLLCGGLGLSLEPGFLLLLPAEGDLFLEAGELQVDFLDELGGQMQVVRVGK